MRRAVLTLAGTAAGLAALLSFKTHSAASTDDAAAPAPSAPQASMAPAPSGSGKAAAAGSQGTAAATQARTVTGAVANTAHGPMQVQLTVVGTKITKATVVQQTNDGAESVQINSFSIPKLEKETLVAQSASIDAVSGASYTSSGYIQSLQSAVDKARA